MSAKTVHTKRSCVLALLLPTSVLITWFLSTYALYKDAQTDVSPPISPGNNLNRPRQEQRDKPPLILLWTKFYKTTDWYRGYGVKPQPLKCAHSLPCDITTDNRRFNQSSLIVVHVRNYGQPLPNYRQPGQRVAMISCESPANMQPLQRFNGFFNWTISYRRDSDVFIPFGHFSKKTETVIGSTNNNYAAGKTRLISWMVSNCRAKSQRHRYVTELQKHIKVDIYGRCGNTKNTCPDCVHKLEEYKFYLAFENSLCDDYITEKLYRSYMKGLVPIVLGGGKYADFLPEHSYIDVADFSSPKELATYLKQVDSNDTLYSAFFEWRKTLKVAVANRFCEMCLKLHGPLYNKVYTNIQAWWAVGKCKSPAQKYPQLAKTVFKTNGWSKKKDTILKTKS